MSIVMASGHQHHSVHSSDLEVLDALTALPSTSSLGGGGGGGVSATPRRRPLDTLQALRRPPIDPIVLAASLSSGPHVTRHHFLHSFGPKVESKQMTRSERARKEHPPPKTRARAGSYANCDAEDRSTLQDVQDIISAIEAAEENERRPAAAFTSKQAPRSERLRQEQEAKAAAKRKQEEASEKNRPNISRLPSAQIDQELIDRKKLLEGSATVVDTAPPISSIVRPPPLFVRCYARTRIPTPHGEVFCHLYRNNRDQKEHLALVIDPAQNTDVAGGRPGRMIRSRTLDEVWGPTETEMERIVRGAYVGRLGPTEQKASTPQTSDCRSTSDTTPPLVRIHSECYTGETIGSQRCDCGEQLDEAIRLIHSGERPAKGVVVYLRQEGRGIGLRDKLMAYNLQDMGHDTVAANILLGHLADARRYDIAAEILRDLGVGSCRLLTNNPEKMEALEAEGIRVTKRVAMVPRIWRIHSHTHRRRTRKSKRKSKKQTLEASIISQFDSDGAVHTPNLATTTDDEEENEESDDSHDSYIEHVQRRSGATLIGGSVTRGPELEKYLRTKVERMGHLLELPAKRADEESHGDEDEERILI